MNSNNTKIHSSNAVDSALDTRLKIGILVPISNGVSNLQNGSSSLSRLARASEMAGVEVGWLENESACEIPICGCRSRVAGGLVGSSGQKGLLLASSAKLVAAQY